MEGLPTDFRDWAHLPPLIVHLISEKVKSITDYVRFRAVCSPWRFDSFPKPRLPPQLPWLMLPYSPQQNSEDDDGTRLFYDLWESKMRKLHLPETIGMMCCASECGWLLLVATGGTELFLLNPITRACIQLPPFTTPVKRLSDFFMIPPEIIREAWDIFPSYNVRDYFEPIGGNFAISRVTFSTDLTDPACLITVFIPRYQGIFCCRVDSSCWTEVHDRHYSSSEFADLTYYNGQFYILHKEIMLVIDPSKASCRTGIICFFEQEIWPVSKFLVQGKYGVYVVFVHNIEEEDEAEEVRGQKYENVPKVGTEKMLKQKFELYQFSEQSPRLLRMITNTSNTAIFFGDNNQCLSVCTDDWDSLEGGSVYRCAPPSIRDMHGSGWHYNIYSAKMDDGKFELVPSDFAKEASIGRSGPAIWFQPNFF